MLLDEFGQPLPANLTADQLGISELCALTLERFKDSVDREFMRFYQSFPPTLYGPDGQVLESTVERAKIGQPIYVKLPPKYGKNGMSVRFGSGVVEPTSEFGPDIWDEDENEQT